MVTDIAPTSSDIIRSDEHSTSFFLSPPCSPGRFLHIVPRIFRNDRDSKSRSDSCGPSNARATMQYGLHLTFHRSDSFHIVLSHEISCRNA